MEFSQGMLRVPLKCLKMKFFIQPNFLGLFLNAASIGIFETKKESRKKFKLFALKHKKIKK